jgi:hypothetical protein
MQLKPDSCGRNQAATLASVIMSCPFPNTPNCRTPIRNSATYYHNWLTLRHDTTTHRASSIPRLIWRANAAKAMRRNDLWQLSPSRCTRTIAVTVAGIQQKCRFKPSPIAGSRPAPPRIPMTRKTSKTEASSCAKTGQLRGPMARSGRLACVLRTEPWTR